MAMSVGLWLWLFQNFLDDLHLVLLALVVDNVKLALLDRILDLAVHSEIGRFGPVPFPIVPAK